MSKFIDLIGLSRFLDNCKKLFATKKELINIPTFAGLEICPAPLYYNGTGFEIKDTDWNHNSYNDKYGLTVGSYYFSWNQCHDVNINGWRLPTKVEFEKLITTSTSVRPGSTCVGGEDTYTHVHWALVEITDFYDLVGLLIFPDNKKISVNLVYYDRDNSQGESINTFTLASLNNVISQGCVFLPGFGYATDEEEFVWGEYPSYGNYWSSTKDNDEREFYLYTGYDNTLVSYINQATYYFSVRLVREANFSKVAYTGDYNDLTNKPTIPSAPGTLNTTATTSQSTSASESLSGSITLHKVSKTGSYNDLTDKPTIPTNAESTANKVTSITYNSTDTQYPSAKSVYDFVNKFVVYGDTTVTIDDLAELKYCIYENTPLAVDSISVSGTNTVCKFKGLVNHEGTYVFYVIELNFTNNTPSWNDAVSFEVYIPGPTYSVKVGSTSYSPVGGEVSLPAYPTVPTISTNISSDATSDDKTTSPKAVKTFVEGKGYTTNTGTLTGVTFNGTSATVSSGVAAITATIPTVPTISTNVATDKADNSKTTGAKAVYDEIHPAVVTSIPAGGMLPNVMYKLGTKTGTVIFSMASATDASIVNHWYWTFETSTTAPTVTWPAAITGWIGGSAPTIEASKHYEISVLDGIGACISK